MDTRRCSRRVVRIPLFLSPLIAFPALAQQELEEIVVTARLRTENYATTPAAIKAFTAGEIQAAGIDRVHDFVQLTPNMTVVQTQNPGNTFITIRGISQARNSDMPVAVVVDGVLMTNPAEFNQELNDIQQIEVLKGPQGALYGRNAIGGAINIVTKPATDKFEAKIRAGFDDGPGWLAQGNVSGPISDKLKYRAALSYSDTDGFLDNTYLNQKADPYKDFSGRLRFTWDPTDKISGDFRYSASHIETTALDFVINNDYGLGSGLTGVNVSGNQYNNPNYTGVPIRVNNPGEGIKNADQLSMKWDIKAARGTFTSITSYDALDEILTGDAFDFRPPPQSFNVLIGPFIQPTSCAVAFYSCATVPLADQQRATVTDWNQSQYLNVRTTSQEFRYASETSGKFNWLAGIYLLDTTRYISTGNMVDTGTGVSRVYRAPRTSDGNPGRLHDRESAVDVSRRRPRELRVGGIRLAELELLGAMGRDVLGALRRGHARADDAHAAELHPGVALERSRQRAEAQEDLGRDAAEAYRALAADGQGHALRRREPRLPQRRLQSIGRRARGRRGRQGHVRRADRRHGRGRHQDADEQQPDQPERRGVRHRPNGRVLLHLPGRSRARRTWAASTSRTTKASRSTSTRS